MGFVTSITRDRTILEIFVERKELENAVYFLRVKNRQNEALIGRDLNNPALDLTKYGEILHSYFCGNDQPYESVKEYILKKYGNN